MGLTSSIHAISGRVRLVCTLTHTGTPVIRTGSVQNATLPECFEAEHPGFVLTSSSAGVIRCEFARSGIVLM